MPEDAFHYAPGTEMDEEKTGTCMGHSGRNLWLVTSGLLLFLAAYTLMDRLPLWGLLFVGLFVLLMVIFRFRTPTSLSIYYLSFVFLALGLGEFWLWTQNQSNTYYEGDYTANYWIPDHELGYGLTPGQRQVKSIKRSRSGELIYDVTYTINSLGFREVAHNGEGPPVFFFGDSFTFGEGVDDSDTLPTQFSQICGCSVFNFGVHGYGPHQFLRMLEVARLEKIGIQKRPALVVFSLLRSHVDRAAGRAAWDPDGPLYQLSSTGLDYRGSFRSERGVIDQLMGKSLIYQLIQRPLSEGKDRQRVLAILEMANRIIKNRYGTDMRQHSVSTAASLSRLCNRGWRQAACLALS